MDKTIFYAGLALVCLGVGFLLASLAYPSLNSAFTSGGYLWLIIGGLTMGFGLKVKRQKQAQMGALK